METLTSVLQHLLTDRKWINNFSIDWLICLVSVSWLKFCPLLCKLNFFDLNGIHHFSQCLTICVLLWVMTEDLKEHESTEGGWAVHSPPFLSSPSSPAAVRAASRPSTVSLSLHEVDTAPTLCCCSVVQQPTPLGSTFNCSSWFRISDLNMRSWLIGSFPHLPSTFSDRLCL